MSADRRADFHDRFGPPDDFVMKTCGLALALLLLATCSIADVKPLPKSSWPNTVAEAIPHILGSLTITQRSIIGGTSKDNLFLFLGD